MLHHYNYSTSLSHFLNYHQIDNQPDSDQHPLCEDLSQSEDPRCPSNSSSSAAATNNKSFTIAAILGLNKQPSTVEKCPADSGDDPILMGTGSDASGRAFVSNCGRLQLPVRHTATGHYSVAHGCPPRQPVRGLKHMSASSVMQNKKSCKSKRVRTIFTPEQLERLEAEFERQQYMVGPERLYLAHTLQLTEAQVKVWFQNRRIKWRKHHLELTHQRLAVLKQQQLLLDDTHPDVQDTNSSSTDT